MKSITSIKNSTSLLTLILILGSGYFVWEKVLPNLLPRVLENLTSIDIFGLDDSYRIDIERSPQAANASGFVA
ncbi:MAG: hypothetical protein AB8B99_10475 [Phormidesmis sp.]